MPEPRSVWQLGPTIDGRNYSTGASVSGNTFAIPALPGGLHYVTQPTGSLTGKSRIVMRYTVTGDTFASSSPGKPATISIYFQRRGDDWSGLGEYEAYRWWFTKQTLTAGAHEMIAPLDSPWWQAVEQSNGRTNPAGFAHAKANAESVGFTLGGGSGLGHGAYGPATLTIAYFGVE